MQKTSKVISVTANGTWDGSYGTMYKFEIVFQNADVGEYSSKNKEQNKFEVGSEVEYEYTGGQYPKVKPVYNAPTGGGGGGSYGGKSDDVQKKIVRQSMLKASVDFHAINPQLKPSEVDILKTAERFVQFVNGNSELQLSKEFTSLPTEPVKQVANLEATAKKDDLPF
tara:strand:+ start:1671 stop:2174 length:504 start_codon:yes stop_codon:yes gene_type:complete